MSDDRLEEMIVKELQVMQTRTVRIIKNSILSLLADKQGYNLDDYTIQACASLVEQFEEVYNG